MPSGSIRGSTVHVKLPPKRAAAFAARSPKKLRYLQANSIPMYTATLRTSTARLPFWVGRLSSQAMRP